MELKAGYKQTEVGVIPEDWVVRTLDSLGRQNRPAIKAGPFGSSLTKDTYAKDGYKVYGQEQVIRGDYTYGDYFISMAHFNELKSCAVEPGDILLSLVGTAGRVLVIPPGAPQGIINPRLIRFSFDQNVISPSYFRFLIESEFYQALLARSAQGGTMGVLNAGLLRPISIPLPSPAEQRAIAAALNDVDALIAALDRLIAKKRDIKQAAMHELLTGKRRPSKFEDGSGYKMTEVGLIPKDWSVVPLCEISNFINGRAYKISEWEEFGTPVIRLQNLTGGDEYYYSNLNLPPKQYCYSGDLLYMWSATFGPHIWNGGKAIYHYHIWKVETRSGISDKLFLYYKLDEITQELKNRTSRGGTMLHITKSSMMKINIALPSYYEQVYISTVLSDIDAEIAALEVRREKTRAIKQGMMQELLTGRIRLVQGAEA